MRIVLYVLLATALFSVGDSFLFGLFEGILEEILSSSSEEDVSHGNSSSEENLSDSSEEYNFGLDFDPFGLFASSSEEEESSEGTQGENPSPADPQLSPVLGMDSNSALYVTGNGQTSNTSIDNLATPSVSVGGSNAANIPELVPIANATYANPIPLLEPAQQLPILSPGTNIDNSSKDLVDNVKGEGIVQVAEDTKKE